MKAPHAIAVGPRAALGFAALCALFLFLAFLTFQYPADDAFISFRYADNLARGNGLVFNPGERVEGYSNPSWTVLLAGLHWLGLDLLRTSQVLGLLSTILLGWVLLRLAAELTPGDEVDRPRPWVAVLLLFTQMGVLCYALSGMETMFFALLLTSGAYRFLREHRLQQAGFRVVIPWSAILFALTALTRPEGVLYIVPVGLAVLGRAWTRPASRGYALRWLAVCGVPLLLLVSWRLAYYGVPLPNTYYAKVQGPSKLQTLGLGFGYVLDFLGSGGGLPVLLCALLAWLSRARRAVTILFALLAVDVLFCIWVGGDTWFPYSRFLVPTVPLLCLLAYAGLSIASQRWLRGRAPWVGVTVIAGFVGLVAVNVGSSHGDGPSLGYSLRRLVSGPVQVLEAQQWKWRAPLFGEIDNWFRRNEVPAATLVVSEAGAVPYYRPQDRVLDLWGLVDAHIARIWTRDPEAFLRYLLDQDPDYFVVYQDDDWPDTVFGYILQDARFRIRYATAHVFVYELAQEFGGNLEVQRWVLFERLERPRPAPLLALRDEIAVSLADPDRVTLDHFRY